MHSMVEPCAICRSCDFVDVRDVEIGGWNTESSDLVRKATIVTIGACRTCGHCQVTTVLSDEEIAALYAETPYVTPTLDQLLAGDAAWIVHYVPPDLVSPDAAIADFGCGNGASLAAVHKYYDVPLDRLIGIDFNKYVPDELRFVQVDLNVAERVELLDAEIDFALCVSTLEHMREPGRLLRLIHRHLRPGGHLMVELPDTARLDAPSTIGDVSLFHPHHLQYFSTASVAALAEANGFEIVFIKQMNHDGYPALACLLKKGDERIVRSVIEQSLDMIDLRRDGVVRTIQAFHEQGFEVCLWGVGGDLYRMVARSPWLLRAIQDGDRIGLFDRSLHGHRVWGSEIRDSGHLTGLPADNRVILITPMLRQQRNSMLQIGQRLGFGPRLVDPYSGEQPQL
jgi:SAM-dependent methyltransferase